MKKGIDVILFCLVIIGSSSCRKKLDPVGFVRYVSNPESGLKRDIQIDGWQYSMQYRPYDFIFLLENSDKGIAGLKNIDEFEKRMAGTVWFSISFKRIDHSITPLKYGITNNDEYNSRLNYFLNLASKDIQLAYGRDTLPPCSYLFENNYNLTPQETMIVGFCLPTKNEIPDRDMQLAFNDRELRNGIIKASFHKRDLENIPSLEIK